MPALEDGRLTVDDLVSWMLRFDEQISAQAERLTELDSAIGDADQELRVYRRTDTGVTMEPICGVAFVPMTGGH